MGFFRRPAGSFPHCQGAGVSQTKQDMKPPAFQFYPDDFLGGTVTMNNAERGLYISLLCIQWSRGSVSQADIDRIATPSFSGDVAIVIDKFKVGKDGLFRNERLESERKKQTSYRESCSKSGKAGAYKRWGRHKGRHSHPTDSPMAKNGSPSPISDLRSPDLVPPVEGPEWESAQRWLADWNKNGADYTEFEARGAFLALQANGWRWGRNPVADPRAALERQIQTDRENRERKHGTHKQNNQQGTRPTTGAEQRLVGHYPTKQTLTTGQLIAKRQAARDALAAKEAESGRPPADGSGDGVTS